MRPQYSQKEDKYEEEIKVLTDKLKEVSELVWFFESVMLNTQYRFLLESFRSYKVLAVVSNADLSV